MTRRHLPMLSPRPKVQDVSERLKEFHMRARHLTIPVLLAFLSTVSVSAQENAALADAPTITVLAKSWSREFPPAQDSLRRSEEQVSQVRAEKDFLKASDQRLPNQPTEPRMPMASPRPLYNPQRWDPLYIYRIKVQNNSTKMITKIYWEYQFIDPNTQKLLGTRKIYSSLKLKPGKTRTLETRSRRQPTVIVSADSAGKKYQDSFTERLIIHRVHYADGTAWQRPATE